MHAKQTKRSGRSSRKRASATSYELVYTVHVQPKRGGGDAAPNLPRSKPIKLSKLMKEKTGSSTIRASQEVTLAILNRIQAQQADLLTALGLDAAKPDYAQAFLELARIHHGVGVVLVENARSPNKNAEKWTSEQDEALVKAVHERRRGGMTITSALNEIANDEGLWRQFPIDTSSRSEKSAASLRAQTLKKRLEIIRLRAAESSQRELLARLGEIGSRRPKPQKKSKNSSGDSLGKSKSSKS